VSVISSDFWASFLHACSTSRVVGPPLFNSALNESLGISWLDEILTTSSSTGPTAHCGLWPVEEDPSIVSYLSPTLSIIVKSIQFFPSFDFRNNKFFYCMVLLASRQTPPTWRTRVSLFVWAITLDLSGMGDPTSSILVCYRQHSSGDHVTTQAPPLRQSRDTFGGY
jgi:hypothetical protein